jgi:hypothetical protein
MRLFAILCLFSLANASVEMSNSWEWTSPGDSSVIAIGPTHIRDSPAVVIGAGNLTLENQCIGILSPSIGSCKDVPGTVHHTGCLVPTNASGTLTAVGTMLNARITSAACTCPNASVNIRSAGAGDECPPGLLVFAHGPPPRTVGGISQLHNVATHLDVARFQGILSPATVTACAALAGVLRVLFMQLRASSFGFESSLFQHVIDASRFSFSCALIAAGVLNLVHLIPNLENVSIDVLVSFATAVEIVLGGLCLVKSTCVRTFNGESRIRCFCRNGAWSVSTFLTTGNLGSAFVLFQGILNGISRETRATGISENVRDLRP